ncbi:adenosylmethionine decarboxylase [Candidatus Methylacidithermus pantelleriae]|uniref:S-adenosylmethionine decarboxylase proenzyme n=1 Tax=Candidatus Methylacidithermus pantelleriae TaxID=2744239 RepID=A0A8J2BKV7_9BACT|nr:adenosylmethionine decarboxylase [Candidatus Methylacidithermus pantelleriae]CAF0697515.1 S-adenosylmethionine decarboxylase proenzyme [Candidatus Methylacidithermus pantelleriae]
MDALGIHLIIELKGCNPRLLDDLPYVEETLLEAAKLANTRVIGKFFHKFSPVGVTGIVAIAESHLCIHTWPEYGYAAVDMFTCKLDFESDKIVNYLLWRLRCVHPEVKFLERGKPPFPHISQVTPCTKEN